MKWGEQPAERSKLRRVPDVRNSLTVSVLKITTRQCYGETRMCNYDLIDTSTRSQNSSLNMIKRIQESALMNISMECRSTLKTLL